MTAPQLTVVICTHNPRGDYLNATLAAIRAQSFDARNWELLVIDNGSTHPVADKFDVVWHPNARVVREERLGLTHARVRSLRESLGDIILYVDDDNVLAPNYLRTLFAAFDADPQLGAVGGKALPRYEHPPPEWFAETGISLGCRDLGEEPLTASWVGVPPAQRGYPACAPIGAGMGVRRAAFAAYVSGAAADPKRAQLGRRGADLASGEDNDMVMSVLEEGFSVAYLPELTLEHLIPAKRLTPEYLARYAYGSNRTWVQVLDVHGICPWARIAGWTALARCTGAYARTRAWASDANYIRWRGACGLIRGQTLLDGRPAQGNRFEKPLLFP